ncbi:hypothetical protein BDR03DRAFT_969080 [Suillus americanus]|nr:hypothetical protein BDR03DRAFT_969080 [Suillus americanus]
MTSKSQHPFLILTARRMSKKSDQMSGLNLKRLESRKSNSADIEWTLFVYACVERCFARRWLPNETISLCHGVHREHIICPFSSLIPWRWGCSYYNKITL